ncbi:MAG: glycosyltransferase family A protein [Oceanicaulis sp.]
MARDFDLSVVIVAYQMHRELPRTLFSISKDYQTWRGAPANVQVIVVDNGSDPPLRREDYEAIGLDLTLVRPECPAPSPVPAINMGLALAEAPLVGAFIDGARLASPGLLQGVRDASNLCAIPVIAPLNWQLGPQRQYLASQTGYDQDVEDRLLDSIHWPEDPDRLFEIAVCEVQPTPEAPLLESNALFLRKDVWDALGGYDPAFDEPGGGCANPDMLLRACAYPGAELVRLVDEGTFHQFHGGVSTSDLDQATAMMKAASKAYYRLRGVPLRPVRAKGLVLRSRGGGREC